MKTVENLVLVDNRAFGHLNTCDFIQSELNADCSCGYQDVLDDEARDLAEESSTDENYEEQTVEEQEENNE